MARRRSTITALPSAFKAEIDRLLAEGLATYDDILTHLKSLGAPPVSRSALGRYGKDFDEVMADIRLTREMASAVGRELKDLTDGDATAMLVESLHALLLKARMQVSQSDEIAPKAVADLSRAAKDLASALNQRAALEIRVRKELAEKAAAKVKEIETEAAAAPMTAQEALDRVRAVYLGEG